MSINRPMTTVVGNLTEDPDLRVTPSGISVCKFRVLQTPREKKGEEWVDGDPFGVNVAVWREAAEYVAESLTRGMRVIVVGELKQRSYEDKEGVKRFSLDMDAEAVGPDLRWAKAKVTKVSRGDGGGSADRPARKAAPKSAETSRHQADEAPPW